jgi:hypothetical protein
MKVKTLMSEVGSLKQDALAAGRGISKLEEADRRLAEVQTIIFVECLEFDPMMAGGN